MLMNRNIFANLLQNEQKVMLMNRNVSANLLQKLTESDVNEQKYIC